MTREQAAEKWHNDRYVKMLPSPFPFDKYNHTKQGYEDFLAGCEHADKEHRERIEQQAQEIERLNHILFSSNPAPWQQEAVRRISELEAQLKDAIDLAYRAINCADYTHISTIREIQKDLLALPKALESFPKEQLNGITLLSKANKNWIVTPRDEPQNQPQPEQAEVKCPQCEGRGNLSKSQNEYIQYGCQKPKPEAQQQEAVRRISELEAQLKKRDEALQILQVDIQGYDEFPAYRLSVISKAVESSPKEQPKFGDWTPEKIAEWKKRTGQEQPEAQQQEEQWEIFRDVMSDYAYKWIDSSFDDHETLNDLCKKFTITRKPL